MPGGSVNGRPFRESSDSYAKTGIPCGNPKRYHSHEVVRMETERRSGSRPIDGPVEEIETAGQKHLQALLQKQLNTKISLQQHFQNRKEFSSGVPHKPGVEEISGVTTLADYQTQEKTDKYIEEMKGYGLTVDEIFLKLQNEETDIAAAKRSRLSNPDHDRSRLLEIERKIQSKKEMLSKPDEFSGVKSLSRHEMQLEKSISQSSHSSRFLHGALIKERSHQTVTDPTDPMNNLKDIMETITYRPFKRKHRRNRKDDSYKSGCTLECCTGQSETGAAHSATKCDSSEECPLEHRELLVATCMEKPADYETTNNLNLAGDERTRNIQVLENDYKTTNDLDLENGNNKTNTQDLENDNRTTNIQDLENDDRTTNNIKLAENDQSNSTALRLAKTQVSFGYSECSRNDLSFGQSECSRNEDKSDCKHSGNKRADKSDRRIDEEVQPSNDEAIETIPEHVIRTYKLSAEEIKKLPRFENYDPGEPNNVLFLKNLSAKVTREDLVALFNRYHHLTGEHTDYKLMTGTMKGQAFITFQNTETASKALELVHGYDFKGKPIIIVYGKKSSKT